MYHRQQAVWLIFPTHVSDPKIDCVCMGVCVCVCVCVCMGGGGIDACLRLLYCIAGNIDGLLIWRFVSRGLNKNIGRLKFGGTVWYSHMYICTHVHCMCNREILVDFNLPVVGTNCLTVNFNSPPIFRLNGSTT